MSRFLLDSNVVFELRKRDRADANVLRWLDEHNGAEFWLSVLVVGELRRGVELIARRDKKTAARLRAWLGSTVKDYADRILPITVEICERPPG